MLPLDIPPPPPPADVFVEKIEGDPFVPAVEQFPGVVVVHAAPPPPTVIGYTCAETVIAPAPSKGEAV